jgi:hypothetical protein
MSQLRTMVVLYGLTLFSEEQRNAGGKPLRAALRRVAAGSKPRAVFNGRDPDYAQSRAKKYGQGGRAYERDLRAGRLKATQGQRENYSKKWMTESSDEEDDKARAASFARRAKDPMSVGPMKTVRPRGGVKRARDQADGPSPGLSASRDQADGPSPGLSASRDDPPAKRPRTAKVKTKARIRIRIRIKTRTRPAPKPSADRR